jgi:3-oxoacyl-[acyl-carrier protein] reductase
MRGLKDKMIVISGGNGGIGQATVRRLSDEGARVVAFDPRTGPDDIETIACDVRSEDEVVAAFALVRERHGNVDGIVSNAAVYFRERESAIDGLDLATWNDTLAVNLTGAFLFCKHGVRALKQAGGGSVVIVGSPNGQYGCNPGSVAYSVSKAGLYGMAKVMAIDHARDDVRVNIVFPGYVPTRLNAAMSADPDVEAATLDTLPIGRAGKPEEIAGGIAFLLSEDASFMTGSGVYMDGGLTAR